MDQMKFYEIPPTLAEEIGELEKMVWKFKEGTMSAGEFRAHRVPFGIYEQRTRHTYMVRIRCTAGGITPKQLALTANLAHRFGAPFLHITTRQEIQIHDVGIDSLIPLLRELYEAGLSTRGGGGNTVRNITASWDAGIAPDEVFDVTPYAISLSTMLIAETDSWTLPRKFKIAFSNSPRDNVHAVFNDLGFVATIENGQKGFRVYVAGGMGTKPEVGHLLHSFIPADEVYLVAAAVKRLFHKYGNRKNKHAARLRFLWRRLGEEEFLKRYEEERASIAMRPLADFREIENVPERLPEEAEEEEGEEYLTWRSRYVFPQKQTGLYAVLIPIFLGNIPCDGALKIANFLDKFGENMLRFTTEQNLVLRNIPERYLGRVFCLAKEVSELSTQPKFFGNLVACTGADTCQLGICLPRGAMRAVLKKLLPLSSRLDPLADFHLHISGCPNTCGAHMAADLGFYGQVGRKGQRLYPSYVVVAGARINSFNPRFAIKTEHTIASRDLPDFIRDFLELYLEKKGGNTDFSRYIDDEGLTDIKNIASKYRDIPDFDEDKNYYYDWGAKEIFSLVGKGMGECSAGLFDLIDLDRKAIAEKKKTFPLLTDEKEMKDTLYQITLLAARMLLITRGVEANTDEEVFTNFKRHFIEAKLVDGRFLPLIEKALNFEIGPDLAGEVFSLTDTMESLYESMDDTFHFPQEKEKKEPEKREEEIPLLTKDFRGVPCPMNFVKTKMELAKIKAGDRLAVLLDDGEPIDNVPRSVAEEGHEIVEMKREGDHWWVLIEKR